MSKLDDWKRLTEAASCGPWHSDYPITNVYNAAEGYHFVAEVDSDTDRAFVIAARTAMPLLLAVAEAAREWWVAKCRYLGIQNDDSQHSQEEWVAADAKLNEAEDDLCAALAALEAD